MRGRMCVGTELSVCLMPVCLKEGHLIGWQLTISQEEPYIGNGFVLRIKTQVCKVTPGAPVESEANFSSSHGRSE